MEEVKKEEVVKAKRTKCDVYSRVSGYMRPVNSWNVGKQEEFGERKTFKIKEETNEEQRTT